MKSFKIKKLDFFWWYFFWKKNGLLSENSAIDTARQKGIIKKLECKLFKNGIIIIW